MRYVKKQLVVKNKVGFEIGTELPVTQVDNLDEAIRFFGGENVLVDRLNSMIARAAVQMPKLRLMNTDGESLTELHKDIEQAKEQAKSYVPYNYEQSKTIKNIQLTKIIKNAHKATPEQILDWLKYPDFDDEDWKIIDKLNKHWEKNL